jgi:hypothetical protein
VRMAQKVSEATKRRLVHKSPGAKVAAARAAKRTARALALSQSNGFVDKLEQAKIP